MTTTMPAGAGPLRSSLPWVMARLKLRLIRNGWRRNTNGRLVFVINLLGALVFGSAALILMVSVAGADDPLASRAVMVLGSTGLVLAWTIFPMLAFGVDDTLDPARLVLLPLRRRPLMIGLLIASLIGAAPLAVLFGAAGAIVGFGGGAGLRGLPIVVVAVALLVLLAPALGRTITTVLAARLTSRRGRDALMIVSAIGALALQGLRFVNPSNIENDLIERACDVARWFPPGMLGQAIVDAHAGRLGRAMVQLIPAAVLLPLLLVIWDRALERSLTVVAGGSTPVRRRHADDRPGAARWSRLFPAWARALPAVPWAAVAAKELRYMAREPRRKLTVVQLVVIGLAFPIFVGVRAGGSLEPGSVVVASTASYIAVLSSMNLLGYDGEALWLDIAAGDRIRDVLIGKNLAAALGVVPVVFVGALILAGFGAGWAYVPAALLIALGGLGVGFSAGNVTSVHFPMPMGESPNPFAQPAANRGCGTALIFMGITLVQGLLLAPIGIASALAVAFFPLALVVVAPAALAYGALIWKVGLDMAASSASRRQPELLAAVGRRAGVRTSTRRGAGARSSPAR